MKIHTIWVSDSGSWDEAYMYGAWDEYSRDVNDTGFHEDMTKARGCGEVREIVIEVEESQLAKAFEVPVVTAKAT